MTIDNNDIIRVVQNKSAESEAYRKQLHIWLGVGSAGGAISMVSLAANLPDPVFAFKFLHLTLWSFLTGVCAAGFSIFFLSLRAAAMGSHYASAHNRDQLNEAIKSIPEMFASPPALAEKANSERNSLIARSNKEHERAEQEWILHERYAIAWGTSLVISALAFMFGFAWPLIQISFLDRNFLP